jgi:hypothetical protein
VSADARSEVVRRLVQLRRIPLLSQLPPGALVGLAEHARERSLRAAEVVQSRLPSVLHLFSTGVEGGELGAAPELSLAEHCPELVPWLLGSPLEEPMRARAAGTVMTIETARLTAAMEDEFSLYLAIAGALAHAILAARPITLAIGVEVTGDAVAEAAPRNGFDLFERVRLVRAMLPFARRHVGALLQLARHTVELRAEPGQVLWREGDAADGALFLVRGTVEANVPAEEDAVLGPGCVLGGFDALARVPRWFTARAREPLLALNLPVERFLDVLEDQHELARDLLRDLARGLMIARSLESMPSLEGERLAQARRAR